MAPFRPISLLLIVFIQYVMRYAVLLPIIRSHGIEFQLSHFTFLCLVLSTTGIAAAGFINGRKIIAQIAFLLGIYVIFKAGVPNLIMTYFALTGMLLLYIFFYKNSFLVGNIIVALFFAIVPMLVLLDLLPIYRVYGRFLWENGINFKFAIYWFSGVSAFLFLTALSCELIKDTEDFEDDNVTCDTRSFPFTMGTPYTKWTISCINSVIMVALSIIIYFFFLRSIAAWFSFFYILFLLIIPISYINRRVHKAIVGNDFRKILNLMKIVIFVGIAYNGVLLIIASSICLKYFP